VSSEMTMHAIAACDVVCHFREWVGCQLNVDS
jgi:hypothetical protein